MTRNRPQSSRPTGFTQWKRNDMPDGSGYEYLNFPSIFARRMFYYVLYIGEARCRQGFHYFHPDPAFGHKDDEGFVLHFVLRGALWHRFGKQTATIGQNDAALFTPRRAVEYGNSASKPVHFYWVWFDSREMPEIFSQLNAAEQPVFPNLNRRRMVTIFRQLIRVVAREPRGHEAEASVLLASLMAVLYAARAPQSPLIDVQKHPYNLSEPVRNALRYIARDYALTWYGKELSEKVGLSLYHFSRLFQRETGYSPIEYLNRYRIEQARTLLAATETPVEQIARRVGIPNREHFSKLFRHIHGLSPREYRLRARRPAQC